MKRRSILIVVLILVVLMTTGAVLYLTAGRTPAVKAKTEGLLKRGGVLIEGLLPGCGKDAFLTAGIDLEDKPGVVAELSKDEVVSEIYNADPSSSSILLDGGKISEARFQFYGDRLISIVLETQNQQSALQSLTQLTRELGEAYKTDTTHGDFPGTYTNLYQWQFEAEQTTVHVLAYARYRDHRLESASIQVGYLFDDLFGHISFEE